MPALAVGMEWMIARFHHAHDKRGNGARLKILAAKLLAAELSNRTMNDCFEALHSCQGG